MSYVIYEIECRIIICLYRKKNLCKGGKSIYYINDLKVYVEVV